MKKHSFKWIFTYFLLCLCLTFTNCGNSKNAGDSFALENAQSAELSENNSLNDNQDNLLVNEKESLGIEAVEKKSEKGLAKESEQEPEKEQENKKLENREQDNKEAAQKELEIVMVGDVLMHPPVIASGKREDGTYNFNHIFKNVKEKIEIADLAIVNQETVLGGTELGISGYPCFNSPTEVGDAEIKAGFDVVCHGTNHALDKGEKGILNTVSYWEKQSGVSYVGIHGTEEDAKKEPLILDVDGIKIAILNYTFSTNGIATPANLPHAVEMLNKETVMEDLTYAKEHSDFVIVCPHWGTEYQLKENAYQREFAKLFCEYGADLILGTHPHVIEPVEEIESENGNHAIVYYSLGNFVNGTSGQGSGVMNRAVGFLADVKINAMKNQEGGYDVTVKDHQALPIVCHFDEGEKYTVYFLKDYTEELASANKIKLQDDSFSLDHCKKLVKEVVGEN